MVSVRRAALPLALLAAAGCGGGASDPAFVDLISDARYVGGGECRHCHLDIATSYARTGMGRSWHRMGTQPLEADFRDDNTFSPPNSPLRYRMLERDGRYYAQQWVETSDGRRLAFDERELIWAVGSNNHNQTYLAVEDGKLFQTPVCWYPQGQLWDLCPGFEQKNDHFTRAITESCVFCHNGRMERVPGTVNAFQEPFPHGIDCERCHGPGSLHVEKWSRPDATRGSGPDPTIVNPLRLPPLRRQQVCAQCHLGDAKATERVGHRERAPEDWRPGLALTDYVVPFQYVDQHRSEFGLSAQFDRMVLSRCYTESDGKLDCLTCHNPHVSTYSPERPTGYFTRKCLQCHALEDCGEEHGARQATHGVADDCVACHMREAEPDDQRHTTFTDHWIRTRIDDETHERRPSTELRAVFGEAFDKLPRSERRYYEGRANMLLALKSAGTARDELLAAAEAGHREALDLGLDDAQAWFFLGKVHMLQGEAGPALEAMAEALQRDPGHYDARFAYGQLAGGSGQPRQAADTFEQLVAAHPESAGALAELGRFRLMARRIDEAIELYTRAVALEPWNAALYLNRAMAHAASGRMQEAAADVDQAARLDPDDPAIWELAARIHGELGDRARAAAARELAALTSPG